MIEDLLPSAVSDWLKDTDTAPPDPAGSRTRAAARARVTKQASSWWPSLRVPSVGGRSLAGTGATAALTVVILSLVLVLVLPGMPTDDRPGSLSGGLAQPGPSARSIHWQTDVVELRADDFRLDVSDLTFTIRGVPLVVGSDPGDEDYWTLEIEWREHGLEQRMNWYFAADDEHWWVTEMRTYDGRSPGEWVYAYGPFFRTSLGSAYEGDVRERLLGVGRPEDPDDLVEAELVIDGLRLSVTPGARGTRTGEAAPGASDRIADALRSAREVLFPQPAPTPRPTEPPGPQWAVDLGGLTLTGELVDEGVLRVTGDGAGNRFSPIISVAIADDGTVWLARRKVIFALGQREQFRTEAGGPKAAIERIEANDDGSLTVHADGLWRLDRGTWSFLEPSPPRRELLGVSEDGRLTMRVEDGSIWRTPASWAEVGPDDAPASDLLALRLDDGWQTFEPGTIFPATRAQHPDEWIVPASLLAMPSGDVWVHNRLALSRFDGAAWEETSAQALADLAGGPVTVRDVVADPEGVLWVLVTGQDRMTNPDPIQRLLRHAQGTWEVVGLEGVLPASGRRGTFYGLEPADDVGVWLMDRDGATDYYVGPGGLTRVSRWTPRDAVEAPDGSVFGTARPRSDGLLLVPAGEIRPLVEDHMD